MRHATQPRRQPEARGQSAPAPALPKFRQLGISAVVAACAWPKRPEPRAPKRGAPDGEPRSDGR